MMLTLLSDTSTMRMSLHTKSVT